MKGNAKTLWNAMDKKIDGVTMNLDQALHSVWKDWFDSLALYRTGRDLTKFSFNPDKEQSSDFIKRLNEQAACTNEKNDQTDVFAGCIPNEMAEFIWKDHQSADISQFQKAFRERCYRSDKKVMEGRKYGIHTLASNRENPNAVNGPL